MIKSSRSAWRRALGRAHSSANELRDVRGIVESLYSANNGQPAAPKLTNRGRGGKNELHALPQIVGQAVRSNNSTESIYAFEVFSAPVAVAVEPHLGDMYSSIVRDCYLRFEMLRGKRVDNHILLQCHDNRLDLGDQSALLLQVKGRLASLYRWGIMIDPKNVVTSVDVSFIDKCLEAIQRLVEKNKIRLDYKPFFYSLKEQRQVAGHDVEVADGYRKTYFVKYRASAERSPSQEAAPVQQLFFGLTFIVESNKPCQLAGLKVRSRQQAIRLHSNMAYSVFYYQDVPYVMASRYLLKYSSTLFAHGKPKKVAEYIGSQLAGITCVDSLTGQLVPVVATTYDEELVTHVRPVCPSFNPADFRLSEKMGLSRESHLSLDGRLVIANPRLNGLLLEPVGSDAVVLELAATASIFDFCEETPALEYRLKAGGETLHMMYAWLTQDQGRVGHPGLGRRERPLPRPAPRHQVLRGRGARGLLARRPAG